MDLQQRIRTRSQIVEGCWLWTGYIGSNGYGRIRVDGRVTYAHRASYEAFVGPIPDGLQIDHVCRNRACVNPGHLEAVTGAVNVQRGLPFRATEPASRCHRGHSLADAYVTKAGSRQCRGCLRDRQRAANARTSAIVQDRIRNGTREASFRVASE